MAQPHDNDSSVPGGASAKALMARKLWGEAPDKREVIVGIACTLFERNGIAATSVTQIAREVGITRELFYYYFANKDSVVDQVLDGYVDGIIAEIVQRLPENECDDLEAICVVVDVMREFLHEGDDLHPSPQRDVIRESKKNAYFVKMLAARVTELMTENEVLKDNDLEPPSILVEFCLLGVFGLLDMHPDLEPLALSRQFKEFVPKAVELTQRSTRA